VAEAIGADVSVLAADFEFAVKPHRSDDCWNGLGWLGMGKYLGQSDDTRSRKPGDSWIYRGSGGAAVSWGQLMKLWQRLMRVFFVTDTRISGGAKRKYPEHPPRFPATGIF
jgi:hypothetical protein